MESEEGFFCFAMITDRIVYPCCDGCGEELGIRADYIHPCERCFVCDDCKRRYLYDGKQDLVFNRCYECFCARVACMDLIDWD